MGLRGNLQVNWRILFRAWFVLLPLDPHEPIGKRKVSLHNITFLQDFSTGISLVASFGSPSILLSITSRPQLVGNVITLLFLTRARYSTQGYSMLRTVLYWYSRAWTPRIALLHMLSRDSYRRSHHSERRSMCRLQNDQVSLRNLGYPPQHRHKMSTSSHFHSSHVRDYCPESTVQWLSG